MSYSVGSVPYVNSVPLVHALKQEGSDVQVLYDVPSRLPDLLNTGQADAIMVSSYFGLTEPGFRYVSGVGIASKGPVLSVRVFAKTAFSQIRSLALDTASMTSNRLAQILLLELHGREPYTTTCRSNLQEMMDVADAGVLIGDVGMDADPSGLLVMDLGSAWQELTGLPFVWALWLGRHGLSADLARTLREAVSLPSESDLSKTEPHPVIAEAIRSSRWDRDRVENYLCHVMRYRLGPEEMEGLRAFQEMLQDHNFHEARFTPKPI